MSGVGDSKTPDLAAIEDNYVEDAGQLKKDEVADNIRQPHHELYAEALQRYPSDEYIDKIAEDKLRRKLDYKILPLLGICYFFYGKDFSELFPSCRSNFESARFPSRATMMSRNF